MHSGSRGGKGCSRAPGRPGEEAGSDHNPGPSSFPALCRPPAPAALKIRPLLITYLTPTYVACTLQIKHKVGVNGYCYLQSQAVIIYM